MTKIVIYYITKNCCQNIPNGILTAAVLFLSDYLSPMMPARLKAGSII